MTVSELVSKLELPDNGVYKGNDFVITLKDSNEYARVYSRLSKFDDLVLDTDTITLGTDETTLIYYNDEYDVILKGNLNDDVYTVTIVGD